MSSFLKIPVLIIAMVGMHVTTTAPPVAPDDSEKVTSTRLEIIVKQRFVAYLVKVNFTTFPYQIHH
ncbi:hypothetical protein BDQ17DRAFT_1346619 [Cyathus striatus]|nr:hypothetical protein BDQ17DRAFT_1346619 [Cyathus striatus]